MATVGDPAAQTPSRYNANKSSLKSQLFVYFKMDKNDKLKSLTKQSRDAMKAQIASFRIEGIRISPKRAEQIRREVVAEMSSASAVIR